MGHAIIYLASIPFDNAQHEEKNLRLGNIMMKQPLSG